MPELKINVYGVELMKKDKMYFFTPNDPSDEYHINDLVLVNSDLGLEVGKIISPLKERNIDDLDNEPSPIIRKLTEEDKETHENNLKDANDVKVFTQEKSEELNLEMRVLKAKYTFDKSKLIIFFGADSRVDFRELVKILAKKYKVRIELRQVGIRDEVKMKGSLGLCGQVACCARFLREFSSIKMELAKTQQMMINTAKISGRCGKLLCCLKYENEFYEEVLRNVPNENSTIEYDNKPAKVVTVNVFLKEVTLQIIEENQPILVKVPFQYFNNLDEKIVKE
jgi:cell fate regulator YaaT (PSP1 superfamily)